MPATIKDIARELKISVSTVSYALNGGPRTVQPDLRERVLETARQLGYRPNRLARSLITRRSHTVGIVPPAVVSNMMLTPFIQAVVNAVVNEAEDLKYDVLIYTRFDESRDLDLADSVVDGRADGVVFLAPKVDSPVVQAIRERGVPFVVLSSDAFSNAVSLNSDNTTGVEQALDHLFELGHRRIAHIAGPKTMTDGVTRAEAYLRWMKRHDLPVLDGYFREGGFYREGGDAALRSYLALPEPPTAVFAGNDEMAIGCLLAAREAGLVVPDDLSIVGFDNTVVSTLTFPALTTVMQQFDPMGRTAVQILDAMIEDRATPMGHVFPTELIVRDSTSRPKEDIHA